MEVKELSENRGHRTSVTAEGKKPRRPRGSRLLAGLTSAVCVVAALVLPGMASAAEVQPPGLATDTAQAVTGASLKWGVRAEWRNYVGLGPGQPGPGATGEITAVSPASVDASFIPTWSEGSGEIRLGSAEAEDPGSLSFSGTMTLKGHPGDWYPNDGWGMIQTFSEPTLSFTSAESATLSMTMTQVSVLPNWPSITEPTRVDLVDITFNVEDLEDGVATSTSAALTAAGAELWGNYGAYQSGLEMDPVTFTLGEAVITDPTPTETTLEITPVTAYLGENIKLRAAVLVEEEDGETLVPGVFRFFVGGVLIHEGWSETGELSYETNELAAGNHSVVAEFVPEGSAYSRSVSAAVSVSVEEPIAPKQVEGTLEWGVKQSFRNYVVGSIAGGSITPSAGASQAANNGIFTFPQAAQGTTWNGETGSIQFAGQIRFYGHEGVLDVSLANPVVRVVNEDLAELRVPYGARNQMITLVQIDLASANRQVLDGGALRYGSARTMLTHEGERFFSDSSGQGSDQPFYTAGTELDRLTFTIGKGSSHETEPLPNPGPVAQPKPEPSPSPDSVNPKAAAGSLRWGVSDYFAQYTTQKSGSSCPTPSGHCAGGSIATTGVGSGWVFPQSGSGDWDVVTQTGTARFSGVVSFRGYGQTMFQVANPSITVTGPDSATLNTGYSGSYGPSSVSLDLGAASKSVGPGGEVTWSGVPVQGELVGISAGQGVAFDSLTFTVGSTNTEAFAAELVEASNEEAGEEPPLERERIRPSTASSEGVGASAPVNVQEAAFIPSGSNAEWQWWASAGALVVIACCTSALAVNQRRIARDQ